MKYRDQSPTSQRYNQSFVKELAKPTRVTAFQDGFRITHKLFIFIGVRESLRLFAPAQKNKINLCFVDRFVQFENDTKIKAKLMTNRLI